MFQTKAVEKIKTLFIFHFFRKSCLYKIMWKNMVQPDRPTMTIQSCAEKTQFTCQKTQSSIHTLIMLNTYYFSTVTVVTRQYHNVTLYDIACLFHIIYN